MPLCLATAVVGMYAPRESAEVPSYVAPWFEGGMGKYAGEPIVIFAGSTTVGQFGEWLRISVYTGTGPQPNHPQQSNALSSPASALSSLLPLCTTHLF